MYIYIWRLVQFCVIFPLFFSYFTDSGLSTGEIVVIAVACVAGVGVVGAGAAAGVTYYR